MLTCSWKHRCSSCIRIDDDDVGAFLHCADDVCGESSNTNK